MAHTIKPNDAQHYFVPADEVLALLSPQVASTAALEELLTSVALPETFFNAPTEKVDIETSWRILNAHYNMANEESHNLSQRPLVRGTTRFIFSNILHCTHLHHALQTIAQTYNVIHGGEFNFVKTRGKNLTFIVDDQNFHYTGKASVLAVEYALLRIHCALSFLAKRPLHIQRVGTPRFRTTIITLKCLAHRLMLARKRIA